MVQHRDATHVTLGTTNMGLATALIRSSFPAIAPSKAAAVCYRRAGSGLEFLLVNTASGKWTFPKGNIEPHLGASQSAALEAFEEAGVKGWISDHHFDFYRHDKNDSEHLVAAYLMQVRQMFVPEESHRNPTWFTAGEAKRKLGKRRPDKYAREFARVIDRAVDLLSMPVPGSPWTRLSISTLS